MTWCIDIRLRLVLGMALVAQLHFHHFMSSIRTQSAPVSLEWTTLGTAELDVSCPRASFGLAEGSVGGSCLDRTFLEVQRCLWKPWCFNDRPGWTCRGVY